MRNMIPWGRGGRALSDRRFGDNGDPFISLHREMDRLFDSFFRDVDVGGKPPAGWSGNWPHVELSETDKDIKVVAELPGLEEKDVQLTLQEGVLAISGEKKSETENPRYSERWQGRFQRMIQLGSDIDPDKVTAEFKNGVLTINVPKRPEAQGGAKRIPIAS
jgi:HSP20 family protein